jgi:LmbE family N-acetylglucosaminyl deacetylase
MINMVVVAHPDDEVLGFGGTGAAYVQRGEIVQSVILCGNANARSLRPTDSELLNDTIEASKILGFKQPIMGSFPNLKMNTIPHLDLVKFIEDQIILIKPDRIFTHHPSDLNDDHKQVSHACMSATRIFQRKKNTKIIKELYFLEILSSTDWAFPSNTSLFLPNVFCDISGTIEKKIKALSCYKNVMRESPHPRSEQVLLGHAIYRGGQCGCLSAEAFQQAYRFEL